MRITYVIVLVYSLLTFNLYSQELAKKEIEKQAERNWVNQNYKIAAEQFEKLLSLDPQNSSYAYKFAISNFLAGLNVEKSLKYIEPLLGKDKIFNDIPYWIGKMYMANYQFNDAIDMFNTYLSNLNPNSEQAQTTQKQINMCLSAIKLLNKPINVTFENLGPNINSSANEFLPLIPHNEELLFSLPTNVSTKVQKYSTKTYTFPIKIKHHGH